MLVHADRAREQVARGRAPEAWEPRGTGCGPDWDLDHFESQRLEVARTIATARRRERWDCNGVRAARGAIAVPSPLPSGGGAETIAGAAHLEDAGLFSLVMTCEANGVNPAAYIADVLLRVQTHPASRIDELLPHNWKPPKREPT